eukprot:gene36468-47487_t
MCGRARVSTEASRTLQVICRKCNSSKLNRTTAENVVPSSSALTSSNSYTSDKLIENLSPAMDCPVLIFDEKSETYIVEDIKWGLIPAYDCVRPDHFKMFNKRIEKLSSSYFSRLVKGNGSKSAPHRCVVVVDGFYEWKNVVGQKLKQPYYIHSEKPLILAGIWDRVTVGDVHDGCKELLSFAILTCESSPFLAKEIHNRQPVMLSEEQMHAWLDTTLPPTAVDELLREISGNSANEDFAANKSMALHPVTQRMTTASYQEPDCSLEVKPLIGTKIDSIFSAVTIKNETLVGTEKSTPLVTLTQQQGGNKKRATEKVNVSPPREHKKVKPNQITDFFKK